MQGNFTEDRGQPNPRQAEVDRLRDAAARSMKARGSRPAVVLDDVSIGAGPSALAQSSTSESQRPAAP